MAIIAIGLFGASACVFNKDATLAPAGAYHGDSFLYSTDLALTSSYSVLDVFVNWEYTNRPLLAGTPGPTKLADNIRANAKQWFSSANALRDAYAAAPTPDNKANLQKVLLVIQAALTQAAGYMALPPSAAVKQ